MIDSRNFWVSFGLLLMSGSTLSATSVSRPAELPQAIETLKSASGRELEREAIWVATCGEPDAVPTLVKFFGDPDFLDRLARAKSDHRAMQYLRSLRVLRSLAQSGTPDLDLPFLAIIRSKDFSQNGLRIRAWIEAVGYLPDPSAKLIQVVNSFADQYLVTVAETLARFASEPALLLLEKIFQEASENGKLELARCFILCRNTAPGVAFYQRLIQAESKNMRVRNRLIQTLFNFEHTQWYKGELDQGTEIPSPPRSLASSDVLRNLLKYADQLDKSDISNETRDSIQFARSEISALLKDRDVGGKK